jgi:adenylylsulfate kinase
MQQHRLQDSKLKAMIMIQLTGLSGSGKTTLASNVKEMLIKLNYKAEVIDGDEYRQTLCKDLGFSKADRTENIRRLSLLGALLAQNEIITIIAAINPYESVRQGIKSQYDFVHTVWLDCDLETVIQRDTKGLYRRAMLPNEHPDKISNLTGINDPFEVPENPDLIINTNHYSELDSTRILLNYILAQIQSSPSAPSSGKVTPSNIPKALFIGRWQPFHNGHKWIVEQKLSRGIPVLIAVRDIPPDEKNPLTTDQTVRLIQKIYDKNPLVSTLVIPDIESINYGRNVGYEVNEIIPPSNIFTISGSEIRQSFLEGSDTWKLHVDPSTHNLLEQYLRPK